MNSQFDPSAAPDGATSPEPHADDATYFSQEEPLTSSPENAAPPRHERRAGERQHRPVLEPGEEEVMVIREPGVIGFDRYRPGPIPAWEVRGKTLYSGISAGTEMTIYRGSNPYAHKRWDATLKLFLPEAGERHFYPAVVGYEEVGVITDVGADVKGVKAGDVVWGSWGHRTEFVQHGDLARGNILPQNLDPRCGMFARIGAIALNGILDAGINVGETVVVFGAGMVGLICMALARLSGARVYAVDVSPARLHVASRYADELILGDAALKTKEWTGGRGADVVIEATGNYNALAEAIRTVAYAGKVVSLGFYQGSPGALALGEEFHHNRVRIICSQIFNVPPELSQRWDVPRLERTIMALQAAGRLDLLPLITQELPFEEAMMGFQMLDKYPDTTLQVALRFDQSGGGRTE